MAPAKKKEKKVTAKKAPAKKKERKVAAKKAVAAAPPRPNKMWLAILSDNNGGYNGDPTLTYRLYDSLEKAISGGINLMDVHSPWGEDWRNGLAGLGQEAKDNYLGFEYYPKINQANGGVLVTNEDSDLSHQVSISIEPMEVNPSNIKVTRRERAATTEDLYPSYPGYPGFGF